MSGRASSPVLLDSWLFWTIVRWRFILRASIFYCKNFESKLFTWMVSNVFLPSYALRLCVGYGEGGSPKLPHSLKTSTNSREYDRHGSFGASLHSHQRPSHCGTKPGHFETSIINFPTSEGVSEVSERANE